MNPTLVSISSAVCNHNLFYCRIPLILIAIILLLCFCCTTGGETRPPRSSGSPSVFVIPIHEEEREEDEDEDGEAMDINEAHFQPPSYSDPPTYSSRNANPPPPYEVQHWTGTHSKDFSMTICISSDFVLFLSKAVVERFSNLKVNTTQIKYSYFSMV